MRLLGDELLVRRAARKLAVQAAALTGAAMLLLIVLVTLVVVRDQQATSDRLLRTTAATADDVGDPPAGSWIVLSDSRRVESTPGLPPELVGPLAALREHATQAGSLRTLDDEEGGHRVFTILRDEETVQVALDLGPQHADRNSLLRTMGVAALLSLVLAGILGAWLGRRAVRPLAEALSLQRSFVADASHELRTPLTLLSTRVQVLDTELREAGSGAQVLADSQGVLHDVQRLGEVVEDLLVAADPRRDDSHSAVELRPLLESVAASAASHATAAGVTLEVDVTASDPHTGDPLVVLGSAVALRRAVLALLDNAIDHTPADGRVTLRAYGRQRAVVVSVADTGPGMPAEAAAGVLQRFHSGGHRAGRAHYGLGLALTHDVANRHGGELRLVPSDIGTTFELVLPILG